MGDTLLVLTLLSLGDGDAAQVEALRVKSNYLYAKALALSGDTLRAINVLLQEEGCRAKRYRLVLMLGKFYLDGATELLEDTVCFGHRDIILYNAYVLNFLDDPLSDSLRSMLPPLLDPGKAILYNLVPGMGLVYAGRPWQGIKTFLANVVGIAGITYSIKNKRYVDAAVWYVFWEGRFLTGSFQNSISAVWNENRRRLKPYFRKILHMIEEGG